MAKGKYPRLITNREKIFKLTGVRIPLTRIGKDGRQYIVKVKPRCLKCLVPVRNLYENNRYYRSKVGVPRQKHVAYRCPKCGSLFPRKLVERGIEVFDGDYD